MGTNVDAGIISWEDDKNVLLEHWGEMQTFLAVYEISGIFCVWSKNSTYMEDITCQRKDMSCIFSGENNILLTSAASKFIMFYYLQSTNNSVKA